MSPKANLCVLPFPLLSRLVSPTRPLAFRACEGREVLGTRLVSVLLL